MGVPQEYRSGDVVINNGATYCFAMPANELGIINRLLVIETSGTHEGFSYEVYSASKACAPGANPTATAGITASDYLIVPAHAVASTKDRYQGTLPADGIFNLDYQYANQDGSSSNRNGRVYVKITPTWTGGTPATKTYRIAMTVVDPTTPST